MEKRAYLQVSEWPRKQYNNIFSKFNRSSSSSKNFITVELKYIPEKRTFLKNILVLQPKEWELDVQCPKCNKRYSVIGTVYFCPFFCKKNIEENFEKSLELIQNKLNFNELFKNDLTKMDENMAEDFPDRF